ncbi:MAG: nucleoside hydrolase [Oscillospiraceae bacterium]
MNCRIPVIIDTDPGIDDAIAIMLAQASDRIEIVGLTPVDGNVKAEHTFKNALNLSEFLGINCPVAKGAEKQLSVQASAHGENIHGVTGLGNVILPEAKGSFVEEPAWDFIYSKAKELKGELVIAAIGPLTNVAKAIISHPDIKNYIKKLVIMGGGTEGGNRTPYAEFNFWIDPPAAEVVFNSGIPIVMAGLNVTLKTGISIDFINSLAEKKSLIADVIKNMVDTYNDRALGKSGNSVSVVHDAIPIFFIAHPECCKTEMCKIAINTEQGKARWGESAVSYDKPQEFNTELITDVDMDTYENFYTEMIEFFADIN